MLQIRPSSDRGRADHGWLDARFTFSFAQFHDPDFMGFRSLRVLNQDRIQPSQGFGTHAHENMEIVTYVLSGALAHRDSMGHGSVIRPGDVQAMSAGTGITHSELNALDDQVTEVIQMWVLPALRGSKPWYEQRSFGDEGLSGRLRLVVSPDGRDGSLPIGQDAALYASRLDTDVEASHVFEAGRGAWLHLARGKVRVNGEELSAGDGAAIRDERELSFTALEPSELLLWDMA